MTPAQRVKLLFGPYQPPRLRVGDRDVCLLRDCPVVVTSWTDACITWPRCKPPEGRSAPGLLVDEELIRAIRHESAVALRHWWGVGVTLVWKWRKAFGVGRAGGEGSRRLIQAASSAGAAVVRGVSLPPEVCEERRRLAVEGNYGTHFTYDHVDRWTPEDLALLGRVPDADVARLTGRSVEGVRIKRTRLGIATARDGRRSGRGRRSSVEGVEDRHAHKV